MNAYIQYALKWITSRRADVKFTASGAKSWKSYATLIPKARFDKFFRKNETVLSNKQLTYIEGIRDTSSKAKAKQNASDRSMTTMQMVIGLLSLTEKRQATGILGLVTVMALLETAGIASVMPFLGLLANPDLLVSNKSLLWLYSQLTGFGVESVNGFLVFLGAGSFVLVVVTALFRAVTHYVMNRFIEMRRHSFSIKLLSAYLRQPYSFFLAKNSGDLSKSVLSEVDEIMGSVVRPVYTMLAYSVVLLAITSPSLCLTSRKMCAHI